MLESIANPLLPAAAGDASLPLVGVTNNCAGHPSGQLQASAAPAPRVGKLNTPSKSMPVHDATRLPTVNSTGVKTFLSRQGWGSGRTGPPASPEDDVAAAASHGPYDPYDFPCDDDDDDDVAVVAKTWADVPSAAAAGNPHGQKQHRLLSGAGHTARHTSRQLFNSENDNPAALPFSLDTPINNLNVSCSAGAGSGATGKRLPGLLNRTSTAGLPSAAHQQGRKQLGILNFAVPMTLSGGSSRFTGQLPAGMVNHGNTCYLNAVLQVGVAYHSRQTTGYATRAMHTHSGVFFAGPVCHRNAWCEVRMSCVVLLHKQGCPVEAAFFFGTALDMILAIRALCCNITSVMQSKRQSTTAHCFQSMCQQAKACWYTYCVCHCTCRRCSVCHALLRT